jgi:uncharacterized membrane protein
MHEVAAAPAETRRRRNSLYVTGGVALALLIVSIVFAADTQWSLVFKMIHVGAAVVWVGGGLFIAICAVLAELANDDDQLLQIGYWAEKIAGRLFPVMSFVVLGFGFGMIENLGLAYDQFWIIFGLVASALSAATGILFLGPGSKRLRPSADAAVGALTSPPTGRRGSGNEGGGNRHRVLRQGTGVEVKMCTA